MEAVVKALIPNVKFLVNQRTFKKEKGSYLEGNQTPEFRENRKEEDLRENKERNEAIQSYLLPFYNAVPGLYIPKQSHPY